MQQYEDCAFFWVGGGGGALCGGCQTFNTSQITGNLKSFKESGYIVFNTE